MHVYAYDILCQVSKVLRHFLSGVCTSVVAGCADFPFQTVLLEKKRLLQQWNSTLIGMRRRDEAYAAMLTAVK